MTILIKNCISETGICHHHQIKPPQLNPIDTASPHLQTKIVVQYIQEGNSIISPHFHNEMFDESGIAEVTNSCNLDVP